MTAASYDLSDRDAVDAALSDLRGYWKFWSSCLLRSAKLPTLRGLIITRRTPELRHNIERFFEQIGDVTTLVRHDRRQEAPPYPRGGFLVPEKLIGKVIDYYLRLNRIVALLEPADPLRNQHNLNILFNNASEVWAEVVGAGFDASDLQRGDLSPHEVFSIALGDNGRIRRFHQVFQADSANYADSKLARREKVRRKLNSSPTQQLADAIRLGLQRGQQAVRDQVICPENYEPIPRELIHRTINAIFQSNIIDTFRRNTGVSFPLNFSTSFIGASARQVYWDIVSPHLKFTGLALRGTRCRREPHFTTFR